MSGIYAHLINEYYNPSVPQFFQELRSVVSGKAMNQLSEVIPTADKVLAKWDKLDYWQLMTRDHFITMYAILLIPEQQRQVRQQAMQFIMQHMASEDKLRRQGQSKATASTQSVGSGVNAGNGGLTLYSALKEHYKLLLECKGYRDDTTAATSNAPNPAQNTKKNGYESGRYSKGQHQGGGFQTTATVSAHAVQSGGDIQSSERKNTVSPFSQLIPEIKQMLDRQCVVGQYHLKTGAGDIPYVATTQVCKKCASTDPEEHQLPSLCAGSVRQVPTLWPPYCPLLPEDPSRRSWTSPAPSVQPRQTLWREAQVFLTARVGGAS